MGSSSKNKGANSKEIKKKMKESKNQKKTRPIPTDLMGPDQTNAPGALD